MANQALENATINNVDPADWREIKCEDRPENIPIQSVGTYSDAYSEAYA